MWSAFRKQNAQSEKVYFSGKSRGGASPPLFLDQTEPRKIFFKPPPLSQGLDDPSSPSPSPLPVVWRSGFAIVFNHKVLLSRQVRFNPNKQAFTWLASGGAAGLARLHLVKQLKDAWRQVLNKRFLLCACGWKSFTNNDSPREWMLAITSIKLPLALRSNKDGLGTNVPLKWSSSVSVQHRHRRRH